MIDGVLINQLNIIRDERGAVYHLLRNDNDGFFGFGECYVSEISVGITKGWKLHKLQTQNLVTIRGSVRLIIFDDRNESNTKGQIINLILGPNDSYLRVTVPPRVWYAFSCLSSFPSLLINCADIPHKIDEAVTRPLYDSELPYHLFVD